MGWWEDRVVPRLVDVTCGQRPIMELRREVCAGLSGRVIEIGFGSGLNLGALPAAVTQVDAVEPSDLAWARSAERRGESTVPVERIGLDGQRIDADDATYDSALVTFSLCTIPDPALALGRGPPPAEAGWPAALHRARFGAGRARAPLAAPDRAGAATSRRWLPPHS